MKRAREILAVLARHGLVVLDRSSSPWSFLGAPSRWFQKPRDRQFSQPEEIRIALEELGATYIKLGQAISTRPDLVPPEYVAELAKLQDDAPEVEYREIAKAITAELCEPPEILYAEFDKVPLAAASIGQVHAAVLSDGTEVAVKVMRPGVEAQVEADLLVLSEIAMFISDRTQFGEDHDVLGWFDEFRYTLRNELRYRREARNADRFRTNFEDDPAIYIPKVYWEYTTDRVLTIERIRGTKISDLEALTEQGLDLAQLARTCALLVLKMIYDHGFFHADPHPGNFFVLKDGTIGLIDTGMVGELDSEMRDALMRLTMGVAQRDAVRLTDEVLNFAKARERVDRNALKRDVARLLETHMSGRPEELSMAGMLNDMLKTASEHKLVLPREITMLTRALTMSEGIGRRLDPTFNLTAFAAPYLEELYVKRYSRDALLSQARMEAMEAADAAIGLPKRLRRLFAELERGELRVVGQLEDAEEMIRHLERTANRMSMSILVAGLIAGASILTLAIQPDGLGKWGSVLSTTMLMLIIVIGIGILISVWRSSK